MSTTIGNRNRPESFRLHLFVGEEQTNDDIAQAPDVAEPVRARQVIMRPTRQYQILLLVSGFLMTFNVIGINFVFAIFQELYTSPQSTIIDAVQRDSLVSLVGTIGSGLTWSGSIFVNPLIARVENLKIITLTGVVIMSLGLVLASFATRLWHLYLTQALLYGIGSSMYYFPIMSITPVYFDKHRGFAMGVILAGSGIGGLVIAPVLQALLDKYGVHWALRILGTWNLIIGIPVACVVRHRAGFGSRGGRTRMNMGLVKRGTFLHQASGAFLQAAGNIIPTIYLTSYSVSVLNYSRSTGSLLLAINSGVNSLSRIAMGTLADMVGRQNTMIGSVFLSGISVFALWYDAPRARFIAFAVFYAIYAGGYNALLPTTITEIYGVENYASVNGFVYFIRGLGSIFGAPLAGVILGTYKRNGDASFVSGGTSMLQSRFNDVAIYSGVLLIAAGVCVSYVRWLDARDKGRWEVVFGCTLSIQITASNLISARVRRSSGFIRNAFFDADLNPLKLYFRIQERVMEERVMTTRTFQSGDHCLAR